MIQKVTTYFVCVIFLLLVTSSCALWREKKVIITKDYVINPNWDAINNSFEIRRLKFKNINDSISLQNASPQEILNKLEEDESFSYVANIVDNGIKYSERKVYFDKDNNFLWHKIFGKVDISFENSKIKIGQLHKNNWYLLGGLSNLKTLYYVYIDSTGKVHSYKISASHWTNI